MLALRWHGRALSEATVVTKNVMTKRHPRLLWWHHTGYFSTQGQSVLQSLRRRLLNWYQHVQFTESPFNSLTMWYSTTAICLTASKSADGLFFLCVRFLQNNNTWMNLPEGLHCRNFPPEHQCCTIVTGKKQKVKPLKTDIKDFSFTLQAVSNHLQRTHSSWNQKFSNYDET